MKRLILCLATLLFGHMVYSQYKAAEYFIGDDPGVGNGTSFTLGSENEAMFTMDLSSLDNSVHVLYVRAQNDHGHWGLVSRVWFVNTAIPDKELTEIEYFIGDDPGFGNGTAVDFTASQDVDIEFTVNLSELPRGVNHLSVRAKDEAGGWSIVQRKSFFTYAVATMTRMEYFINEDPGFGNGTSLGIESNTIVDDQFTIDVSNLPYGMNRLFVRAQNADGHWGLVNSVPLYVGAVDSEIVTIEYFFDTDPGFGAGNLIAADGDEDETFVVELTEPGPGFHQLYVRTLDDHGIWSLTDHIAYYVIRPQPDIIYAEYFVGDDPGFGFGTEFEFTAGTDIEQTLNFVDLTSLDEGDYEFNFRVKDEYGNWSLIVSETVFINRNDPPVIDLDQSFDIEENSPEFTEIGQIVFNDPDPLDEHTITISSGNDDGVFALSEEGVLSVNDNLLLDYETNPSFDLEITVSDGEFQDVAIITINLLDIANLLAKARDLNSVYGDDLPQLIIDYTGFVGDDTAADIVEPSISTTATSSSDAGIYEITLEDGLAEDYELELQNGELTIDKATLQVVADDKSKVYGENNPELTISYNGFVNADDESSLDNPPIAVTTVDEASDAGDYAITLSEGTDNNYDIIENDGLLTVNKASLSATADDQTRLYGAVNPDLTITYIGFVNDDTAAELDTPPVASTIAEQSSDVGDYSIELSEGTDNNYEITSTNGTLTVTKALLTATADGQSKVYGETNPDLTISYAGFANDDNESDLDSAPIATTTADEMSDVGNYSIELSDGTDNNYEITEVDGLLAINQATLTASADNQTRIYGEMNPELTISYDGFVNEDDLSDIDSAPSASTLADALSDAGAYGIELSDGSDNNYDVVEVAGTLTVNKAPLTITADDQVIELGSEIPTLTMSFAGFVNGDDENDITIPNISTDATSESEAGTYDIVLQGGDATNYELILVDGTLTIEEILSLINNGGPEISVYPNPIIDEFVVSESHSLQLLHLYSLSGKLVQEFDVSKQIFRVSNLPSGVYSLMARFGDQVKYVRLIKR